MARMAGLALVGLTMLWLAGCGGGGGKPEAQAEVGDAVPADATETVQDALGEMVAEVIAEALPESLPEGAVTLEDLPAELASAVCALMNRCAGPFFALWSPWGSDCTAGFTAQINAANLPMVTEAVADGSIEYDPVQAGACVTMLAAAGCGDVQMDDLFLEPECLGVFQGQVAPGGACIDHEQCQDQLATYCDTTAACPGVCASRKAKDQPCSNDDQCQPPMRCDGVCRESDLAALGEACNEETGPKCVGLVQCVKTGEAPEGTCKIIDDSTLADKDASCDPQARLFCKAGLACALVPILPQGYGWLCKEPVAAGETCNLALPAMCPADHYCTTTDPVQTGTCEGLPVKNQPCVDNQAGRPCAEPYSCVEGVCKERQPNNAACTANAECLSDNCFGGFCAVEDLCHPKL